MSEPGQRAEPGPSHDLPPLSLYSIVVPAQNEEGSIASMLEHLHAELKGHRIAHEIIVVDDGSTDKTWPILERLVTTLPILRAVRNPR